MYDYKIGEEVLVMHNNVFKIPLWYPGIVIGISDEADDTCPIDVQVQIPQKPTESYTCWMPLYRIQPKTTFEIMGMTNETVKTNHPHS